MLPGMVGDIRKYEVVSLGGDSSRLFEFIYGLLGVWDQEEVPRNWIGCLGFERLISR
jgi:hypothetical protein